MFIKRSSNIIYAWRSSAQVATGTAVLPFLLRGYMSREQDFCVITM